MYAACPNLVMLRDCKQRGGFHIDAQYTALLELFDLRPHFPIHRVCGPDRAVMGRHLHRPTRGVEERYDLGMRLRATVAG